MGTKEQRFEVSCRDRTGQGVRRQRVIQEVLITIDGRVFCRCQKPKVHHLPCSHVIAACSVSGLNAASYVSQYFTKEAAAQTWCHEICGIGILGPFTQKNPHPMLIPDLATKRGIGRRQTRCIRNCNEHGTIHVISSDFGDRMTTQSMGLMILLSEHF